MTEKPLNQLKLEPLTGVAPDLKCDKCGYEQHSQCVQWVEWGSKFLCKRCQRGIKVDWVEP